MDGSRCARIRRARASRSPASIAVRRRSTLELRPDLDHSIVLTRPGYEAVTRQVSLSAGEQRTLVRAAQRRVRRSHRARAAGRRAVVHRRQAERRRESDVAARRDHARDRDPQGRLRRFQGQRHAAPGRAAARRDDVADAGAVAHRRDARGRAHEVRSAVASDADRPLHDGQSAARAGPPRQRVAARRRVQARLLSSA